MKRERILITVKTYPTLSRKYGETVCTAGVREDGSWVRIYPVPFRRLGEKEQYSKYDWIECDLVPSTKDPRPETRHPVNLKQFVAQNHVGTNEKWRERRELLLKKCRIYTSKSDLVAAAHENRASLGIFKPTEVKGFVWTPGPREWDSQKLDGMRRNMAQGQLFDEEQWTKQFRLVAPLPYKFSYRLIDAEGAEMTMRILDWELGALYWNCLKAAGGDEGASLAMVKQKYFDDFTQKDLHLFVGTTQQYHFLAKNPWLVIGAFPIPHDLQGRLF